MSFTAFCDKRFDQKRWFEPLKWLEKKVKEVVWFFWEKLNWVIWEWFKQFNLSKKSSFFLIILN